MTSAGSVGSGAVRVGAIDCGTNSIRLLVSEGAPGEAGLTDVVREMRIIRLGEGVDATGRLSEGAISRCRTALTDYVATMAELGVHSVRMVATSATRDAANKDEFFGMTAEVLGKHFPGAVAEVISGQTEAELTFAGGVSDLSPGDGPFVVTDLGGGSTEIVVGELVRGEVRLLGARSLDIGCVRITERVLHSDPPTADEIAEARAVITAALAEAGDVPVGRAARWVGVAGTFTTMSALAQNLGEYDPERIHGSVISLDRMREVCDRLVGLSVAERRSLGPMHPGRADVIGGGAIVVQTLCDVMAERAGLSELTVSEKDILDGIATSVLTRLAG
ncbi:Ppx/GppA phosphatase family protein [Dietzia cinnamea]|uniref:Ppx/GppA phosphatase family protein n=1 Tax=Dietzia cinnamea TaxID=321318 RepID=UPI00223A781B|nr:Ppx/GppA phosphatase family protein [Dietzia cinnamea]MCT2061313.1 Ppx/GppA family phosphatase [Dietzia cinnamea]MCT2236489.1 Ppx/GppA family phosphatase [Dietzia cinnamea]MCT2300701.1 Ppx/GppA family phosphatase [Dietzia cinnamea]